MPAVANCGTEPRLPIFRPPSRSEQREQLKEWLRIRSFLQLGAQSSSPFFSSFSFFFGSTESSTVAVFTPARYYTSQCLFNAHPPAPFSGLLRSPETTRTPPKIKKKVKIERCSPRNSVNGIGSRRGIGATRSESYFRSVSIRSVRKEGISGAGGLQCMAGQVRVVPLV